MPAKPAASRPWNIIFYTLNWIFWSNLTILFNKWILESTPFRYPILLTTWHLLFATLATQLLAQTTTLLNSRHSIPVTPRTYITRIAPVGILYSGSLACSNTAYIYLNVGFIQMLKASGPVITLLTSYLYAVTTLSVPKVANILFITACVALTVSSEIQFSWTGVALQVVALVFDANRLVILQLVTAGSASSSSSSSSSLSSSSTVPGSGLKFSSDEEEEPRARNDEAGMNMNIGKDEEEGLTPLYNHNHNHNPTPEPEPESESEPEQTKENQLAPTPISKSGIPRMDPLLSLYYTAPICFLMNALLAWKAEIEPLISTQLHTQTQVADENRVGGVVGIVLETGVGVLVANACVGFMLNVAVFTL
ncbi:hypothetical protein BJX70DRAFT_403664, partial [Aspergillus crustosus]